MHDLSKYETEPGQLSTIQYLSTKLEDSYKSVRSRIEQLRLRTRLLEKELNSDLRLRI